MKRILQPNLNLYIYIPGLETLKSIQREWMTILCPFDIYPTDKLAVPQLGFFFL